MVILSDIATIVTAVATTVAAFFIVFGFFKNREINKKADIKPDTKADIMIKIKDIIIPTRDMTSVNSHLDIFNQGKSTARNIRIKVIGEDDDKKDPWLVASKIDKFFPIDELHPNQDIGTAITVIFSPKRNEIKTRFLIQWDDDNKKNNEKKLDLYR